MYSFTVRTQSRKRQDNQAMRKNARAPKPAGRIKLRLDAKTIITVMDERAVECWRKRYPGATRM